MYKNIYPKFLLLVAFFLFLSTNGVNAANMPLSVINIKPAGSGTPAIPAENRIFHAYPGVEYKIRAAVVGGDYPYSFSLSNAPSGMTVDNSGYIRWSNPQANANNISLQISDSSNNSISTTWSINVHTSNFKFVDRGAVGGGDGSFQNPYSSIAEMAAGASSNDIIYFRTGTYDVPARGGHTINNASAFQWYGPTNTSVQWLTYPGESVTIDLMNNRYFYGTTNLPFYFEGLKFYRGREYFFRASSELSYVTFLDNTFDTLTLERTEYNSNQGTYFTMYAGRGHNLIFQGNTFYGFRGTQGIGSLYDQDTILVENNHFSDFDGANSTNQVLAFKVGIVNLTLRGNVVNLESSSNFGMTGGSTNGCFFNGDGTHGPKSENIEILYNYFNHFGISSGADFNRSEDQGTTWVHRNTFVSDVQMTRLSPGNCDGPWYFNNNVFENSASGISDHYANTVTWSTCLTEHNNNLGATSNLVDANGLLTGNYSSYVGIVGWQFSDGTTPIAINIAGDNIAPNTPVNLSVL
jgi:Putative Ig domain